MLQTLAHNWWLFALRGVAAIILGILAFAWPGVTLVVLVALFAAYALVDGASLLVALVRGEPRARRHGWAVGIMGVISVVAGIVAIAWPGITALALLYVVAFWAIAHGVFQVIAAIALRREIEGELWMAIGGVIAILFGLYLAVFPGAGLLSLVVIFAIWAILFGISSLIVAFRLRGQQEHVAPSAA